MKTSCFVLKIEIANKLFDYSWPHMSEVASSAQLLIDVLQSQLHEPTINGDEQAKIGELYRTMLCFDTIARGADFKTARGWSYVAIVDSVEKCICGRIATINLLRPCLKKTKGVCCTAQLCVNYATQVALKEPCLCSKC